MDPIKKQPSDYSPNPQNIQRTDSKDNNYSNNYNRDARDSRDYREYRDRDNRDDIIRSKSRDNYRGNGNGGTASRSRSRYDESDNYERERNSPYDDRDRDRDRYANIDRRSSSSRSDRDRDDGRSYGNRSTPISRRRSEISEQRETGIVCSVKDQYGFIRCSERDEDLFFHFTEIPGNENSSGTNFNTVPSIGLEAEFSVATDLKTGKLSAVKLLVLPKGTIKIEDISTEVYIGVITNVTEDRDSRDRDIYGDSSSSTPSTFGSGEIQHKYTDEQGKEVVEILKYQNKNLGEPKVALKVEDSVKFRIAVSRRTKQRTATDVVIYRFGGNRDTGVITSLKDTFGFIECTDSPNYLFFHYRDVCLLQTDQPELFVGMEVEYTEAFDYKSNKPMATRVRALPKGTIKFEITLPERVRGIIVRQLISLNTNQSQRIRTEEMGAIKLLNVEENQNQNQQNQNQNSKNPIRSVSSSSFENDSNIILYTGNDLESIKYNPKEGDEVEFNIVVKKRNRNNTNTSNNSNNRRRATNIVIVKEKTISLEHGIITSIHKNYGHIVCLEREEDMFFHFSDVLDNNPSISSDEIVPGLELEFVVVTDYRNNKQKAVNTKVLPKGSVQFEQILPGVHQGIIKRECRPGSVSSFGLRRKDECGLLEADINGSNNNTEQQQTTPTTTQLSTLPFVSSDINDYNIQNRVLWPGDEVSFEISIDKKTNVKNATHIKLVKAKELPIESGVVISVKNYFGFMRSPDRDEEIYFHFTELEPIMEKKEIEKVRPGYEFQYSVAIDLWSNNKPIAVKMKQLPKGTVQFDDPIEGKFQGVVITRGRSDFGGKISVLINKENSDNTAITSSTSEQGSNEISTEKEEISFDVSDIDKKFFLKKGDKVEFKMALEKRTKNKRAKEIVLLKEMGTVDTIKSNSSSNSNSTSGMSGYITSYNGSHDQVYFSEQEVEKGVTLKEGDVVEFLRIFNSRTKEQEATEIKRIRESTLQSDSQTSQSIRKQLNINKAEVSKVFILRNPNTANWTAPFAAGRGKLLPEERMRLTNAIQNSSSFSSISNSNSGISPQHTNE